MLKNVHTEFLKDIRGLENKQTKCQRINPLT